MKPRVREEVGRVTPCAPSSQRKQSFALGNVHAARHRVRGLFLIHLKNELDLFARVT